MAPIDYTHLMGPITAGTGMSTITIGSVSMSFAWDPSKSFSAQIALANWLTAGTPNPDIVDFAMANAYGLTENYTNVTLTSNARSRVNPMQLGLNLDQNWSYVMQPSDYRRAAFFQVFGTDAEAFYTGRIDQVSMHAAAEVPEPSGLFFLGLAPALLFASRRGLARR